jgi:hypothetical protein
MKRQTKQFVLRLLGESIIISGSVFFALYIDGWSKERADRKTEKAYIARLINDIEADSVELMDATSETNAISASLQRVLSLEKENELDKVSLAKLYSSILIVSTFRTNSATYEALKYNGDFNLIRDQNILSQVIDYYFEAEFLKEANNESVRLFHRHVDLLTETGSRVDSTNTDEFFRFYRVKTSRGLLISRKGYAEKFILIKIRGRQASSQALLQALRKYQNA